MYTLEFKRHSAGVLNYSICKIHQLSIPRQPKIWIIRQETENQTEITTTLLYEAECLHLDFCRSDGPFSRQAYERVIRIISDSKQTPCKRIMNKLGLHWKENEIMGENMRDPYKTINRIQKVNKAWLGHHHFQLKKIFSKHQLNIVCSKPNRRYFIRSLSGTWDSLTQTTQY